MSLTTAEKGPEMRKLEPILVVHGTFAQNSKWFTREGDFCRTLDEQLKEFGSPAECWSHLNGNDVEFSWSGANSELRRRMAGGQLLKILLQLERRNDVGCYHLISHSHGGNVVVNALALLKAKKMRTVTFLGCPFIETSPTTIKNATLWLILPALLAILSFYLVEPEDPKSFSLFTSVSMFAVFWFAIGTIRLLGLLSRRRQFQRSFRRGSFLSFVMSSRYDEAYASLVASLEVRRNCRQYAKMLIGRYNFFPDISYWYFKWLNFMPVNLFHTSNWFSRPLEKTQQLLLLLQTGMAAIMYFPVLYSIYLARLYGLRIGLNAITAMAIGDDLLDERITSISRRPKWLIASDLPIPKPIDEELKAKVIAHDSNFLHGAYETWGDFLPTSVAEMVRQSLIDEHVVHSQYYKHQELIFEIAAAISGKHNSSPPPG